MLPVAAAALLSAGVVARPPGLEAADPPWVPPPCARATPADAGRTAWYRLDGVLDATGTLASTRLALGLVGSRSRSIELPPESFATGPFGTTVLVGADDGTRSRLSLVDPAAACTTELGDRDAVVRSALLDARGRTIVEHRVDRASRADLGVWATSLASGRSVRIQGAPGPDDRYGPTFTTDLRWADDGRLVVTSCGVMLCRTRVIDLATRRVESFGPTGPVLGVAADGAVIARAPCGGDPCAILRHAAGGATRTLLESAGAAVMAGGRVVFATPAGGLATLDAVTGAMEAVDDATGLRPLAESSTSLAGATHAPASVLLADGRVDGRSLHVLAAASRRPTMIAEVAP